MASNCAGSGTNNSPVCRTIYPALPIISSGGMAMLTTCFLSIVRNKIPNVIRWTPKTISAGPPYLIKHRHIPCRMMGYSHFKYSSIT